MTRSVVIYLGWRLLAALLINILLIVAGIRLLYVEEPLTLYESNGRLYDVPSGLSREVALDFVDRSGCEYYRSGHTTSRHSDSASSEAVPPDWLTLTQEQNFVGYSPQQSYFTVGNYATGQINIYHTADRREMAAVDTQFGRSWWSADERYVAHIGISTEPRTLMITDVISAAQVELRLAVNMHGSVQILWSPHSDHFAYYSREADRMFGGIGTPGGEDMPLPTDIMRYNYNVDGSEILWPGDGRTVHYWTGSDETGFQLIKFDFVSNEMAILRETPRHPVKITSDGHLRAVYTEHTDGTYSIDVLDVLANTIASFVTQVDGLGNPYPHPSGEWVIATLDTDPSPTREIRVAWMRPDGSDYAEYNNPDYVDIRHLEWAEAERSSRLAFVGVRPEGTYDLLVVDVATGDVQTIITGATDLLLDHEHTWFMDDAYAYSDPAGQWYVLQVDDDFQTVLHLETPVYVNRIDHVLSPDGERDAIMLHGEHPYRAVAFKEGDNTEPDINLTGLSQWGAPIWSPNGELARVVLDVSTVTRMNSTVFLDNNGNVVQSLPGGRNGQWIACG